MATEGSTYADAPDYSGNASLVQATMPPVGRHDRLAVTRTYFPGYLPSYVDEYDDDGNVTKSASSMYANAVPKVRAAVGNNLFPGLNADYSMNFIIRVADSLVYGHKFTRYNTPGGGGAQAGDLDPYDDPYQNPKPKPDPDDPSDDGTRKGNPLVPFWWDPCNKNCNEPMYLIPTLHYTYTDKDGNVHKTSTPVNPKTGKPLSGTNAANGGTVKNDCSGQFKTYDNSAGWQRIMDIVGQGSCGSDVYPEEGGHDRCGAHETEPRHSDCVGKCISKGRVDEFTGTQGPYFEDVVEQTGKCGQKINAPTSVRYDLCFNVREAEESCIQGEYRSGVYGGIWFDFCSCHGYNIMSRYSLGKSTKLDPKEQHELCIPYRIPVSYDGNGCPYVDHGSGGAQDPVQPMGPTKGQNDGSWDSGDPDTYMTFDVMPESAIPSDWFDDKDDDGDDQYMGYETEAYFAFSQSALRRHARGENT